MLDGESEDSPLHVLLLVRFPGCRHPIQHWRMTLTQQLLDELDRDAARTKRVLEQVAAGHEDWKPHQKSMALGRLAGMIATMPAWITFIAKQDELDLTPPDGGSGSCPHKASSWQRTTRAWPTLARRCKASTIAACSRPTGGCVREGKSCQTRPGTWRSVTC